MKVKKPIRGTLILAGAPVEMIYHHVDLDCQLRAARTLSLAWHQGALLAQPLTVNVYRSGMFAWLDCNGCAQISSDDAAPITNIRQCSDRDGFCRQVVPIREPSAN